MLAWGACTTQLVRGARSAPPATTGMQWWPRTAHVSGAGSKHWGGGKMDGLTADVFSTLARLCVAPVSHTLGCTRCRHPLNMVIRKKQLQKPALQHHNSITSNPPPNASRQTAPKLEQSCPKQLLQQQCWRSLGSVGLHSPFPAWLIYL